MGNEKQVLTGSILEDSYSGSDSSSSTGEPPSAAFLVPSEGSFFSHSSPHEASEETSDSVERRDDSYEKVVSRSGVSCRFTLSYVSRTAQIISYTAGTGWELFLMALTLYKISRHGTKIACFQVFIKCNVDFSTALMGQSKLVRMIVKDSA